MSVSQDGNVSPPLLLVTGNIFWPLGKRGVSWCRQGFMLCTHETDTATGPRVGMLVRPLKYSRLLTSSFPALVDDCGIVNVICALFTVPLAVASSTGAKGHL